MRDELPEAFLKPARRGVTGEWSVRTSVPSWPRCAWNVKAFGDQWQDVEEPVEGVERDVSGKDGKAPGSAAEH